MAGVSVILGFERFEDEDGHVSEVKCDAGGNDNAMPAHFAPPGDDSHPLPGDYTVTVPDHGQNQEIAVGYHAPNAKPISKPGEKRLYARDEDGNLVAVLYMKRDGTLHAGLDDSEDAGALASKANARCKRMEDKLDAFIGKYNGHKHASFTSVPDTTDTPLGNGDDVSSERLKLDK